MDLYLLRHGIAIERATGRRDRDRPLTGEGAKRVRRIAEAMCGLGITFDLILSSPYNRAKATADIVARKSGAEVEITPLLEPGKSLETLVSLLAERSKTVESVLLVGHEPALSTLVSVLVCGHPGLQLRLRKGGLCRLRLARVWFGQCGILEWLLAPRHLVHG